MTFSATPFALQNGSHSADLFRQAVSSLVPPGGGIITTGDLAVTQTSTPSMNVSVGVGRCWIPGTNVGNVVGGNFSSQAMYYGQNPSAYTVAITTADPINPRIDVIYAGVQDSQYAGTTNAGVIGVATGAPAGSPTVPAIPANSIALANVAVAANATSIVNANISAPTPALHALNPSFGNGTAYTPIWTGVTDFGSGGSLTGTYWVQGDRVTVRSRAKFGASATIGTNAIYCPLPPGYPIAGTENAALGTGFHVNNAGVLRPLVVFAGTTTTASVWSNQFPVNTLGSAGCTSAANEYIEITLSYQTKTA